MKSNLVPILAYPRQTRNPSCRNRGFNQPSLFTEAPALKLPILSVEPVPKRLAIAPNRFYLVARQDSQEWHYPIQFEQHELDRILPRIRQLNWTLGTDGMPRDIQAIHWTAEQMLAGGAL